MGLRRLLAILMIICRYRLDQLIPIEQLPWRARLLASRGEQEGRREDGLVVVNADMAVRYISEGYYGETLCFEAAFSDFHRCGFDIVYRVSDKASGRLVAEAKTAHLLMSPTLGKAVDLPSAMLAALKPK